MGPAIGGRFRTVGDGVFWSGTSMVGAGSAFGVLAARFEDAAPIGGVTHFLGSSMGRFLPFFLPLYEW